MSESALLAEEIPATEPLLATAETVAENAADDAAEASAAEATPPAPPTPDQRSALLTAVQGARDLPPGVRDRLANLLQQAVTLDVAGEPLLATRQVIDLLAQGLPPVLRRERPAAIERPAHPDGDAFFALNSEELSDQQAEQIARQQLDRAGLLRSA